ncbi:MAG: TolC family protein [Bacteroidota bacterium]
MRTLLLLLMFIAPVALAQPASPSTSSEPEAGRLETAVPELPTLDQVMHRVLAHAPRLQMQQALVEKNRDLVRTTGLEWLDAVEVNLGSTYGADGTVVPGALVVDPHRASLRAGVSLRVSLFDVFGRSSRRGAFEHELDVARHAHANAEMEVRREVVGRYEQLKLTRRLVEVRAEGWRAADLHRTMAETAFAQGDLPVSELARVTEIAARAHEAFETARTEYLIAFGQLNVMMGR